jgi:hypothetical protein
LKKDNRLRPKQRISDMEYRNGINRYP